MTKNVATQEMKYYASESKWHVLVNVTITWEYVYSGAHAFRMRTSLCWRPRSEIKVRSSELEVGSVTTPSLFSQLCSVFTRYTTKKKIQNAWSLLASCQWTLCIYPHQMVTFTSTCHVLSNVYTPISRVATLLAKKRQLP
jgi:hypothetical protein